MSAYHSIPCSLEKCHHSGDEMMIALGTRGREIVEKGGRVGGGGGEGGGGEFK